MLHGEINPNLREILFLNIILVSPIVLTSGLRQRNAGGSLLFNTCNIYHAVLRTLPEHMSSSHVFSGVPVVRSLVFCVMCCRSLFVLLSCLVWPLCCLSFDLRILITLLISSSYS